MQFTMSMSALRRALACVLPIVNRSHLPVLEGVLIETRLDGVTFTVTDLACRVTVAESAAVITQGACVVPGSALRRLRHLRHVTKVRIEGLPPEKSTAAKPPFIDRVRVTPDEESPLHLVYETETVAPAEDFPSTLRARPEEAAVRTTVPRAPLRALLTAIQPFASKDTTRPHLCGIFLAGSDNALAVTATNGHRLSRYETAWEGNRKGFQALLDAVFVRRVLYVWTQRRKEDDGASVGLDVLRASPRVWLYDRGLDATANMVEPGLFPGTDSIFAPPGPVPPEHIHVTVEIAHLRRALEAAMAFRESAQKGCVLKLAPGDRSKGVLGLVYEPRDEGRTRLSLAIPARFEGDGAVTRVGIDVGYFLDVAKSAGGKDITLRIHGTKENEPVHLFEQRDDGVRGQHAIMPMRI